MRPFISKYKFIIIGIVAIFAIFIGYGIFKSDPKEEGSVQRITVGINSSGVVGASSLSGDDSLGDEFVIQLLAIQNINFNTEFFNDPVYRNLVDQFRPLGDRPVGRPNPFYPIGQDNGFVGTSTAGLSGSSGTGFVRTDSGATVTGTSTTSGATRR